MAYQSRCPECSAKLRFDEAPDPDEAIECPKCGHVYEAADAKPIKKKVMAGGGGDSKPKKKASGNVPKKRKVKKKKSNPVILWVMLAGAAIIGPAFCYIGYKLFFSTGKIGQIMSYIPPECNWMRGVDVERIGKYKSMVYQSQLKQALDGSLSEGRDDIGKALGADPEKFLDYAMTAKIKNGGDIGTMHVFTTIEPFASGTLLQGLGGKPENIDGQEVQKLGAKTGVMNGAYVFCPTDKMIIVVPEIGDARGMVKKIVAAKTDPKNTSMQSKLGDTGKKVSRAHIWNLMRPEGDLKGHLKSQIADPLNAELSTLSQKVASAKMFGVWMWFGKDIKYGLAIETASPEEADSLAKSCRENERLGKGDDTELPRSLLGLAPMMRTKEVYAEFMSNLEFKSYGNMAFLQTKMIVEKSMMPLSYFNKVAMWEAKEDDGGGGRMRR